MAKKKIIKIALAIFITTIILLSIYYLSLYYENKKEQKLITEYFNTTINDNNYHKINNDKYYKDCYECHIDPNWLLFFKYVDDKFVLLLNFVIIPLFIANLNVCLRVLLGVKNSELKIDFKNRFIIEYFCNYIMFRIT